MKKNKLRLLSLLLVASLCTGCGATENDNIIESEVNNVVVEEVNNDEALLVENTTEPTLAPEVVPVETEVPEPNDNIQSEMNNVESTEIPEITDAPVVETSAPTSEPQKMETPKVTEKPVVTENPNSDNSTLPTPNCTLEPTVAPQPTKAPVATKAPTTTQTPSTPQPVATPVPTVAPTIVPVATQTPVIPAPVVTEAPAPHVCREPSRNVDNWVRINEVTVSIGGGCTKKTWEFGEYCECGAFLKIGDNEHIYHTENIFGANVDPTCTEEGSCVGVTCDCGQYYQPPVIYPALGHDYERHENTECISRVSNENGTTTVTYATIEKCSRCESTRPGTYTITF